MLKYPKVIRLKFFEDSGKLMNKVGCRCDRKEHIANKKIKESNLFT